MNQKRHRLAAAVLIAATGLGMTLPAIAHEGHRHDGHHAAHMERMAAELGLTEAQQADIERIRSQAREQAQAHREALSGERKRMHELIKADSFDEAAVRALAASGQQAKTELAVIRARKHFDIRQVLTPEQREKMAEMHGKHMHKHKHRHMKDGAAE